MLPSVTQEVEFPHEHLMFHWDSGALQNRYNFPEATITLLTGQLCVLRHHLAAGSITDIGKQTQKFFNQREEIRPKALRYSSPIPSVSSQFVTGR